MGAAPKCGLAEQTTTGLAGRLLPLSAFFVAPRAQYQSSFQLFAAAETASNRWWPEPIGEGTDPLGERGPIHPATRCCPAEGALAAQRTCTSSPPRPTETDCSLLSSSGRGRLLLAADFFALGSDLHWESIRGRARNYLSSSFSGGWAAGRPARATCWAATAPRPRGTLAERTCSLLICYLKSRFQLATPEPELDRPVRRQL